MKAILDKLQEIKSASDHSFGIFMLFIVCSIGAGYLSDIREESRKTNTLLKTIINQQKDTVNVKTFKSTFGEKNK